MAQSYIDANLHDVEDVEYEKDIKYKFYIIN